MLWAGLAAIGVLAVIFIQDLRTRTIWWGLPVLLFVTLMLFEWEHFSWKACVTNGAFIVFMMVVLTAYIALRTGRFQNPFKEHFGLGDLLFILALTPLVQFPDFVYYFTLGTIFTLLFHGVALLVRRVKTIPYAGYFSLFTAIYLVIDFFQPIRLSQLIHG